MLATSLNCCKHLLFLYDREHFDELENAKEMKSVQYQKLSKRLRQYTRDGVFVAEFDDIDDAVNKNGGAYQGYGRCCRRGRPHYLGYIWRYENDDEFSK